MSCTYSMLVRNNYKLKAVVGIGELLVVNAGLLLILKIISSVIGLFNS